MEINGLLQLAALLKEYGSFELIQRAETLEDFFPIFDCFDILKQMGHEA